MKRSLIIINLIILAVVFVIAEICFYHVFLKNASCVTTQNVPYWHSADDDILKVALDYEEYPDRFHYLEKIYDKEPVLLLGCS